MGTTTVAAGSGNWTIAAPDVISVQAPAPGSTEPLKITINYDPIALLASAAHGIATMTFTEPPGDADNFGVRLPVQFAIKNDLGVQMDGFTLYTANEDPILPPDTTNTHPQRYAHFHSVKPDTFPGETLDLRAQDFSTPAAFGDAGATATPAPAVINATGKIAAGSTLTSAPFVMHGYELANHNDSFTISFVANLSQSAVDQIVAKARTPTAGDDKLVFTSGNDDKRGLAGNDTIMGLAGNDRLIGDAGNDSVDGGDGNDTLDGSNGRDTVVGGAGDDLLYPGADGDPDTIIGGLGNDTYYADGPEDTLIEQPNEGTDTVYALKSWTLGANFENLVLQERMAGLNASGTGNAANNVITGNSARNRLDGAAGDDTLYGGGGGDTLLGGLGHDTLYGGTGNDRFIGTGDGDLMNGNQGADVFQFQAHGRNGTPELLVDAIGDFTLGTDKIAVAHEWGFRSVVALGPTGQSAGLEFSNGEDTLRVLVPGTYGSVNGWLTTNGHSVRDLFTTPINI